MHCFTLMSHLFTEWPALLSDNDDSEGEEIEPGTCEVNLDKYTGEHQPLLIQDGKVLYPLRENLDGDRLVLICMSMLNNLP